MNLNAHQSATIAVGTHDLEPSALSAADLYCDVPSQADRSKNWVSALLPGVVTAVVATLAAGHVSFAYGVPLTLTALLIGLAMSFLGSDARLAPGLELSATGLLRAAIVVTGSQISLTKISVLGWGALIAVPAIMCCVFGVAFLVARLLRLDWSLGALYGGGVAICGMSAIAGISSVLPRGKLPDAHIATALVSVSACSAVAMIAYPALCRVLGLNDVQAGFLLGAAIHDVSQTIGAGYSLSRDVGELATLVKLTRVALLGPVMLLIALLVASRGTNAAAWRVPWFLLGFLILAVASTLGWLPEQLIELAGQLALGMLAMAITATAIRSPLPQIIGVGWRPVVLVVTVSVTALLAALVAVSTIIE